MPIYEYKCLKNGHQFEVLQKITDDALKSCQVCQGPVEKMISSTSFQLKGAGWYVTDYKSSGTSSTKSGTSEVKESAAPIAAESVKTSDSGKS